MTKLAIIKTYINNIRKEGLFLAREQNPVLFLTSYKGCLVGF